MDGDNLIISGGHYYEFVELAPGDRIGYVDHYRFSGDLYRFVQPLIPTRPPGARGITRSNGFGDTLDVSGNVVAVGAAGFLSYGAVFMFDLSTGAQSGYFRETQNTFSVEQRFAWVVRASGSTVAVSQPRQCGTGPILPCRGRVRIYELRSGTWTLMEDVERPPNVGDPPLFMDAFGAAIALHDRILVVADTNGASGGPRIWRFRRSVTGACASPTPPTACWVPTGFVELDSSPERGGLAYDGTYLVQSSMRGGTDADTGAATGIARIYHESAGSFTLEGEAVFPNNKYGPNVDLHSNSFIVFTEEPTVRMVIFNRSP